MKLFRRRLWDDEKRAPLLIRQGPIPITNNGDLIFWRSGEITPFSIRSGPGDVYYADMPFVFGTKPPGARSTEIKLALTLMGSVASGMHWEWP